MSEVKILNLSYGNFVSLEDYEKLQQQLKQRDEVIDEAIKYVLEHTIDMSVDGDRSDLMFEKANGYELLKILQRYKGDNK